jgi:hypothetical protein
MCFGGIAVARLFCVDVLMAATGASGKLEVGQWPPPTVHADGGTVGA